MRRYQNTATDDVKLVRPLRVDEKQTPANFINFANLIIEKSPFQICEIKTDNGH